MTTLPAGYPSGAFEAFAFLKTRRQLSLDDIRVLAVIECFGEVFYETLARGVDDAEARALLQRNAQEERGHAHRLLKAIELKGGAPFTLPGADENPFLDHGTSPFSLTDDLMTLLVQGEVDGDLQYQAWADAEPDPAVAKLYRQNGTEETRHSERVAQARARLQALRAGH
jgi:rubrerythrin